MSDKPLHVRFAEALGHTVWEHDPLPGHPRHRPEWIRVPPPDWNGQDPIPGDIPRYDTEWAATGPLIERYKITLFIEPTKSILDPTPWEAHWYAYDTREGLNSDDVAHAATPLEAVCHLLLALHAAGKLRP